MSFRLPTADHPARELIDVAHVAEVLNPANAHKLLTIWQARKAAELSFAECGGAIRRICFIIVRADTDQKWLVSFGPKGGWRKEWNFGTGRD